MSCSDLQNLNQVNTNIVCVPIDKDVKVSLKKNTVKSLRCSHPECKKKIDMMKFDCRCGLSFCMKHKNSYQHNCKYDYKQQKKVLDKVVAEKVIKIN